MTNYVIAYVPAAFRYAAESAIAPYLLGAGDTFTVPLASTSAPTVLTHWGCCAPLSTTGQLFASLDSLVAAFPGSAYQVVDPDQYQLKRDWIDWLFAQNLEPKQEQI